MVDWLIVWGVANVFGFAFKKVLLKLAQGALEDYVKDFFKESIKSLVDLAKEKPVKQAFGQAQAEFLQLVQQELEDAGLEQEEIDSYNEILSEFCRHKSVLEALGKPMEKELGVAEISSQSLDIETLAKVWNDLINRNPDKPNFKPLPTDFNWQRVGKRYVRKVRGIVADPESEKLRELVNSKRLSQIQALIRQGTPILPKFNLSDYQERLKEAYSQLNLDTLALSGWENPMLLWDMFKPQNICEQSPSRSIYISVLDLINNREEYKYTVILGDPGSGKSTLTRYKALQWAENNISDLPLLEFPLLIELRNYIANRNKLGNFLEYFEKGSGVRGGTLNKNDLHDWLTNHQSIVMFDGLDEVLNLREREDVVIDIINFKNDYPKARILITSRVIGYEQQRHKLETANFRHFMLQDFDEEQIRDFIAKWHELAIKNITDREQKRDRLQNSIDNSPAFRELAGNPLLLTMMAILNRYEELPRDRSTLYKDASQVLLQKWEASKYLSPNERQDPEVKDYLNSQNTYKDKMGMLRQVAHKMQVDDNQQENQLVIDEDTLEKTLANYLKGEQIIVNKSIIFARALMNDLTTRSFILCFVGGSFYGFVHKTFLEYFCASYFVDKFETKRELSIEELKENLFAAHWQDSNWHEVLSLIVSMLDEKFAGQLLDCLIVQNGKNNSFDNLFLAFRCLSDIRHPLKIQPTIAKLYNKLKDIAEGKVEVGDKIKMKAEEVIPQLEEWLN